jgi:hypothetical protein
MDPTFTQPLILGAILAVFAVLIDRRELGRHRELVARMDRFETRVDGRLDVELGQLRGEIIQVRSEIAALRSDLTHVALALRVQPRPQTG